MPVTTAARQADALVAICAGTTPTPATVVVHVDADTLDHDAEGACHLDGSANLSPATTNAASSLPPRLRRDLAARDHSCCRIPGCGSTGKVHAHHSVHRAHNGPNHLDSLLTLCPFHHRLVHEAGYRVELLLARSSSTAPAEHPSPTPPPTHPPGPTPPPPTRPANSTSAPTSSSATGTAPPPPRRPLLHHRRPQQRQPPELTSPLAFT
mgnify:CR=1 FL=1